MKKLTYIVLYFFSLQTIADISISGSASGSITSVDSSSSSSAINLEVTGISGDTATVDNNNSQSSTLFFSTEEGDDFLDDFILLPLFISTLFDGDTHIDYGETKSTLNITASSENSPTVVDRDIDSNKFISFNKRFKNTPYNITGTYYEIDSSSPSVIPSNADLAIGCLSCINTVDRDIFKDRRGIIGIGATYSASPKSSVYGLISYMEMNVDFYLRGAGVQLSNSLTNWHFRISSEGRVDKVGVIYSLSDDLSLDISETRYHLNTFDLLKKKGVKLIHNTSDKISRSSFASSRRFRLYDPTCSFISLYDKFRPCYSLSW
jgi:hypothetical protein